VLADGCAAGVLERYLLAERGLAAGTVVFYLRSARRFVDGLPPDRGLAGLAVGDVTAAVLRVSEVVSVSAAQNFVSGLRSFLRFCFVEGLVESDLSQAVLLVRGRSSSPLPRGISRADARALLGSCDRRHALGRRDYAIIILLLRLGLRRGEVAGLMLPGRCGSGDRFVPALRAAAKQSAGGVPAVQGALRSDRFRDGRLDCAPGVPARRDRGVRVAPAAAHGGVRDGESQRSACPDRSGAAPSELAEHRYLRARRCRAAAAVGDAVAGGAQR
jgi:hypothetical protein